MRRCLKIKAPQLEHAQLSEDLLRGEALRPSRGDLVSPPQKSTHALFDIVIHRPIRLEPRAVGEVVGPPAYHAVELALHLSPRAMVTWAENLPDASLDP